MEKFKVGDRVKRAYCDNGAYVKVGEVGTILETGRGASGGMSMVRFDGNYYIGLNYDCNMELVSETRSTRHPSSQRFHDFLKQLGDLHDKKMQDYGRTNDPFANVRGSADWGAKPWVGSMIRANDKLKRLQKFASEGKLVNESVMDSFLDLAGYALIAAVLFEEQEKGVPEVK